MDENIYKAPKANLTNDRQRKGSPVKAVLVASAVDVAGTLIIGLILAIGYGMVLSSNGYSPAQIAEKMENLDPFSIFSVLGMVCGFAVTIYAGYLCAKIVNHAEFKIVTIYGVLMIFFGLLTGSGAVFSPGINIILNLLSLLGAYLGGWYYVSKKKP